MVSLLSDAVGRGEYPAFVDDGTTANMPIGGFAKRGHVWEDALGRANATGYTGMFRS